MLTLNDIATAATGRAKITRNMAFESVTRLIARLDISKNDSRYPHIMAELIDLYSHFAPAAPRAPKNAEQWMLLALANKKDPRSYLRFVHVKNGTMYATNGHILFWAQTERDSGFYDSAYNPVNLNAKYPDVERVVDVKRDKSITDFSNARVIPLPNMKPKKL